MLIWLVVILAVASLLRFYKLGDVPRGLTWDEAAIGYNGFAIWNTRRDEWLQRMPISFRSFGDYKAPLAIYSNAPFTAALGITPFAIRLPFALAGIATVAGMMALTQLSLGLLAPQQSAQWGRGPTIWVGALVAISPWHLHFSRTGFESGIALAFLVWGMVLLLYYLLHLQSLRQKTNEVSLPKLVLLLTGVLLLVASMYTYHSSKVVVPLVTFFIAALTFSTWRPFWRQVLMASVVGIAALIPLLYDSVYGEGLTRAGTSIFGDLQGGALWWQIAHNFWAHLSLDFLIHGATTTLRHGDGHWGILLPSTLLFAMIGLLMGGVEVIQKGRKFWTAHPWWLLVVGWIVIGFAPAVIGEEIPHPNRALLALPGLMMLATYGLFSCIEWLRGSSTNQEIKGTHGERGMVVKAVLGTAVLLHAVFFARYLRDYYSVFSRESADSFKDGYLEAFTYIVPYEKGLNGKQPVDKIVFTSEYGQPYIYALLVRQTNPIWYQGGSLIKYEFTNEIKITDLDRKNAIVVGGQKDDLLPERAQHLVYGSDGTIRFKIYVLP